MHLRYHHLLPLLATILLSLPVEVTAQGIWEWQNPRPTGSTLFDVEFLSSGVAVAAGNNATLMISRDSGTTWKLVPFPTFNVFSSIAFLNDRVGLLGGTDGKIYRTEDAGESWSLTNTGESIPYFQDIHILDGRNVAAVGGTIIPTHVALRSTDGGTTWFAGNTPDVSIVLRGVWYLDSLRGWAVGDAGYILRTVDAGRNWTTFLTGDAGWGNVKLHGIAFLDSMNGLIVGDRGTLLRTIDGGETWTKVESGSNADLYALRPLDGDRVIVVGNRVAFASPDRGGLWTRRDLGGRFNRVAVSPGSGQIMAVGEGGAMALSNDGGNTWEQSSQGIFSVPLRDVSFVDADHGVVVGDAGETAFTTDGGEAWRKVSSGTLDQILDVEYPTPNTVFAFSKEKTFFKSIDGGASWTKRSGLSSRVLNDISFADARNGMIVGQGIILTTTDGGTSWRTDTASAWQILWGVSMADSLNAMVAGRGGAIYRTTDGGTSWESRPGGFTATFTEVRMFDSDNAIVRSNQGIVRTTDGGATWATHPSPGGATFNGMSFVDPTTGWIAGENGVVYTTVDGGSTWDVLRHNVAESKSGSSGIRALCFPDRTTGWLVGSDGLILRYRADENMSVGREERTISFPSSLKLTLQPNPANRTITIAIDDSPEEGWTFRLYDALGRQVLTHNRNSVEAAQRHMEISIADLPEGVYYAEVRCGNGEHGVGAVVIQR